jgi:hypothetical protein
MPYRKISEHEGGVKRCPECRNDSMKYDKFSDAWICFNIDCGNRLREEFFQTALPSTKELEEDDIQPDNLNRSREKPFIKSLHLDNRNNNDYEESLNLNLFEGNSIKYRGSAQDALKQDLYNMHDEISKEKHATLLQSRLQYTSNIIGHDSTETQLNRFHRRQLEDRQ